MTVRFIPPMLLLKKETLPDGPDWLYEIKLDGYRAIAFKSGGRIYLRSRNDKDFTSRYPAIVEGLGRLPDETLIDGEVVSLDEDGRPSFNVLQNFESSSVQVFYYVFDVMYLAGRNVMREPLDQRRERLQQTVLPKLKEPVRYSSPLPGTLPQLVESVKAHGLEGLVAKRLDSFYESGKRSGAWQKMRLNREHEFVIGGYTAGGTTFDGLVFGYYEGKNLIYVARTRNGFTPHIRMELVKRFHSLELDHCPFANLPEDRGGRWGQGLTKEKMKECRWLKPVLVGRFEFLEWTPDNHLRHSRFVALVFDRDPKAVGR
jgi:DNA ligase D-like protein (predicted ligase)